MSAMISLSKLTNSNNATLSLSNHPGAVNVNVKPNVSVNVGTTPKQTDSNESSVVYPDGEHNPYEDKETVDYNEYMALKRECEVMKIIIDMLKNNPLMYNGFIVVDDVQLMRLIQLLTDANDVQLETDDLGEGCFTKKIYRKVHTIYVIKDGKTLNLKYNCPDIMKKLSDMGISLKFVW